MKLFWILLPVIILAGCRSLPSVDFVWPKTEQDKQIVQLEQDLKDAQKETEEILAQKTAEIVAEETSRVSLGTSQVYAAHGTLEADPVQDKYTDAATRALAVAKEALPIPEVEDLLEAIEIQKKLLSEQAKEIEEGRKLIAAKSTEIIESKRMVKDLEEEKIVVMAESQKVKATLESELVATKEKQKVEMKVQLDKMASQSAAWEKENGFWQRINPLNGLARTFSSLMFWVVLLVVIGGGLKLTSIFFPGVGIIQAVVGGVGRVVGGVIGIFTKWIPDALRGMNAVDYKEYSVQRQIADNSVGALQEVKYDDPEIFEKAIKPKLKDWNKEAPELKPVIEQKLKDLNLV